MIICIKRNRTELISADYSPITEVRPCQVPGYGLQTTFRSVYLRQLGPQDMATPKTARNWTTNIAFKAWADLGNLHHGAGQGQGADKGASRHERRRREPRQTRRRGG